ncbi:sensor domain-containing diguanylate cyclase [Oceanospirillum multiglobuliferum]|uniref:sensor domain-containing diguanylate cyclase n=1 Tax=Oceanospirillum multiglobuliferum TaxID=64969 RepID=UPI001356701D|nr:diguanylate cyclase [Oceanospirillum multiglobuliferum]
MTASPKKGRKRLYLGITAVVGFSISLLAYWYTELLVGREQRAVTETMAYERQALLLSSINATTEVLDAVGALIDSSEKVEREEFKVFTYTVLQRHPEFWAIHWMPKVMHAERPNFERFLQSQGFSGHITELSSAKNTAIPSQNNALYYPVFYTEPMEKNHSIVGFDASSRSLNQKAMQATLEEGIPFASTAPFKLIQDSEGSASVVFFRPVFGPEHISQDTQQRKLRIQGFVGALVKPQVLLEQFAHSSGVALSVVDVTENTHRAVAKRNWESVEPDWLHHQIDFMTVGRKWRFEFAISPEELVNQGNIQSNRANIVLFTGLLVTLLILWIMRDLVKTHQRVERERDKAQTYLDTVETIIIALDVNGHINLINRKGCELLGYDEHEILHKQWFSEGFVEQARVLRGQYKDLMQGQTSLVRYTESVIRLKNGQLRLIAWHNALQYDVEGNILGTLSAGEDVTRQHALLLLERSRSQAMQAALNGYELNEVLTLIIKGIEAQDKGAMCSVLLLDGSGQHLHLAAAPSLPEAYNKAIDGVAIGEAVGSCGTAAYRKARVIVEDIQQHPYWANYKDLAISYGLASCWSEPILGKNGRVLGTFAIYHAKPSHPSAHDLELIESHAGFVSMLIEQYQAEARLLYIANTDELTNLPNRRQFMERLGVEFSRSNRYGTPLSLLMIDIDHFKKVNDQYGHAVGDDVLRLLAKTCLGLLRDTDIAGRLGGEEFAVVLPQTDQAQALQVAERMLQTLAALELELADQKILKFTVSIGVATFTEQDNSADALLSRADHCLYYAKQNGRNQVSIIEAELTG